MIKRDRYKEAGVDIEMADRLVERIGPLAKSTRRKGVVGGIGGFGGLFSLGAAGYKDPLLVSGTDGVGTKLKIAQAINVHDTVGIDLVAMCANDVVTCGAEPLFFLDYFATGKLDADVGRDVIAGIAEGCRQAGCALIGGETAEMPGFYQPGEYDLAGFVVGAVERDMLIDGSRIEPGDTLIGLPSNGLHSNGFSLARKIFFADLGKGYDDRVKGLRLTLGRELLRPTRIYVKTVLAMARNFDVRGMAHITGGGITDNLPRVLPKGCSARVDRRAWKPPAVFRVLQREGEVDDISMFRTFNMGIGMVLAIPAAQVKKAAAFLARKGEKAHVIGEVIRKKGDPEVIYNPGIDR